MFQRPATVQGREISHYELVARGAFPRRELFGDLLECAGGWITMWDVPDHEARYTGAHTCGHKFGFTKVMVIYLNGNAKRISVPPHVSVYNYRPANEHDTVILRPVFVQ